MNLFFNPPKITLIYTGLLGLFYLALTIDVIRNRWSEKRGLGHDTNPNSGLFKAVRIHGNFYEYIPFMLFMMALDEMTRREALYLHAFGLCLISSRVLHFVGIKKSHGTSPGRASGMALTIIPFAIMSIALILKGLK